ncbi:soluble N-ethylmaleimide-sensitive factor adaptor protein 30 [Actinidia rufa]|uniref:Soluble N-ethylmaleimide-sensitive factor adaptor protein 30 n=1 Tax=Actinidia rufa TaxID=165716 RepID=A0A7J0GJ97_9ERIC|nr:soluble N-ethylmaleimide-sensitive factor adaptor protein 30 [Actinidia rufa]
MFGFRKSPVHKASNPSTSDTELDKNLKLGRRTSSEPELITPNFKPNPFDDDDFHGRRGSSTSSSSSAARNKHKKGRGYSDSEDFDSMSVQELESYAVNKAEDTTKSVNNCLKIAEDIRQDATRTLDTLHQQGEQIHRTHMMAADMDKDLSKVRSSWEILGACSLCHGRQRRREIFLGPQPRKMIMPKESKSRSRGKNWAQLLQPRQGLLLVLLLPNQRMRCRKLRYRLVEKAKQDDALSDLSNILGDLKGMAVDMGTELNKQNKALDHLHDDMEELNARVKGANRRARHLIGK